MRPIMSNLTKRSGDRKRVTGSGEDGPSSKERRRGEGKYFAENHGQIDSRWAEN